MPSRKIGELNLLNKCNDPDHLPASMQVFEQEILEQHK